MHRTSRTTAARTSVVASALATGLLLIVGPASAAVAVAEPAGAEQPATTTGGTVTWTVQPATPEGPDGRISLRHVLDPGASVVDHVTVTNFSERAATFAVYAADGVVSDSGDFDVPGSRATKDGGGWVTLGDVPGGEQVDGTLRLTLEPGARVTVPLTIAVPADATPGDHPAGVVAELVNGDDVRLAARVGARLHLRVTGDVVASLAPQDVVTRWEPSWNPFAPGTVHVSYRVANTGDVRLSARAATTLAGPFGVGAGERATDLREVLPGQSAQVEAELHAWPLVRFAGHVDARPWVVGEDVVDAPLRPGTVPVVVWALPWPQVAALAVLVGVPLLVRWWRRRSARALQDRIAAALAAAGVAAPTSQDSDSPATVG